MTVESLTLKGGLEKTTNPLAVSKINSVDIVDVNSKALRIDGDTAAKRTLKDATFDHIVATAHDDGVTLGGTFHEVDLSVDALARKVSTTLEIDVDHKYKGAISTTGDIKTLAGRD